LKVETQILEDHQARIVAEFEPEVFAAEQKRAARDFAKRVKIPGFRPGKAPYHVIERTVGADAIRQTAIENLVKYYYAQILEEAAVQPYDVGILEEISEGEAPSFRFLIPLQPEITLGDYRSLRRSYACPTVSDDDVMRVITDLQNRQAVVAPAERPVQPGDQVTVRLRGQSTQVDAGQEADIIPERTEAIDIAQPGDDTTHEWPFPGFSSHLVGMSVGEEKTVTYAFPDDHDFESMRNQEASFHIVIEDVKSRALPTLDDDFAQTFGDFATLEDLKARIRANIIQETQQDYDRSYLEAILNDLVAQSTIKFPPNMVDKEIDVVLDEISVSLERSGASLETYLKVRQMDQDALRTELRPTAEARIRRSLLIREISRQEQIQVNPAAIQMQAYQTMNQITKNLSGKDLRKAQSQEFATRLVGSVTNDLYTQATLERVMQIAKGEAQNIETATVHAALSETERLDAALPPSAAEPGPAETQPDPATPAEGSPSEE
jgi:trigger factor